MRPPEPAPMSDRKPPPSAPGTSTATSITFANRSFWLSPSKKSNWSPAFTDDTRYAGPLCPWPGEPVRHGSARFHVGPAPLSSKATFVARTMDSPERARPPRSDPVMSFEPAGSKSDSQPSRPRQTGGGTSGGAGVATGTSATSPSGSRSPVIRGDQTGFPAQLIRNTILCERPCEPRLLGGLEPHRLSDQFHLVSRSPPIPPCPRGVYASTLIDVAMPDR